MVKILVRFQKANTIGYQILELKQGQLTAVWLRIWNEKLQDGFFYPNWPFFEISSVFSNTVFTNLDLDKENGYGYEARIEVCIRFCGILYSYKACDSRDVSGAHER